MGEKLAESICSANLLEASEDDFPAILSYDREVRNICGSDMRTDFVLSHKDGSRSVLEVKTVVDTDIETASKEDDSKKRVQFISTLRPYKRAAVFPWGNSRQVGPDGERVVSARAIRHVDELARISAGDLTEENGERLGASVLFICGRGDAQLFRPNHEACPSFARHLKRAREAGVKVMAHRIEWGVGDDEGRAFWGGRLPVHFPRD